MNPAERTGLGRRVLRLVLVAYLFALVCVAAYGAGFAAELLGHGPGGLAAIPTRVLHPRADEPPEFQIFWEAWGYVERDFYGELPADDQELAYSAIRGMLQAVDDPYTYFTEPSDHEMEEAQLEGRHGGIGAEYVMADGYLVVVAVLQDSPAARVGIRTDDVIVSVDGTDVMGLSQNEAIMLIRGQEVGTEAVLTILREGEAELLSVKVMREEVEVPTVVWELRQDDVGYMRITFFGVQTSGELTAALKDLKSMGADRIILDLRDNPGGMVTAAVDVAGQFIDTGVVFYERDQDGHDQVFNARRGGEAINMPLAVLVNRGTASASEIVGGAIQDHERGILIGEQTFGKGSLQSIHELSDNSSVHVTIAHWLTPDRHEIQEAGLLPDLEVIPSEEALAEGRDPQLEAALSYFGTHIAGLDVVPLCKVVAQERTLCEF
jgi:carboxyl-terminal processing protease